VKITVTYTIDPNDGSTPIKSVRSYDNMEAAEARVLEFNMGMFKSGMTWDKATKSYVDEDGTVAKVVIS
jgi:hypothetical protein